MKSKFHYFVLVTLGILMLTVISAPDISKPPPRSIGRASPPATGSPAGSPSAPGNIPPGSSRGADAVAASGRSERAVPEVAVASLDTDELARLKMDNSEAYFRAVQRQNQLARGESPESPPSEIERQQAAQMRVKDRLVSYLEAHKK